MYVVIVIVIIIIIVIIAVVVVVVVVCCCCCRVDVVWCSHFPVMRESNSFCFILFNSFSSTLYQYDKICLNRGIFFVFTNRRPLFVSSNINGIVFSFNCCFYISFNSLFLSFCLSSTAFFSFNFFFFCLLLISVLLISLSIHYDQHTSPFVLENLFIFNSFLHYHQWRTYSVMLSSCLRFPQKNHTLK